MVHKLIRLNERFLLIRGWTDTAEPLGKIVMLISWCKGLGEDERTHIADSVTNGMKQQCDTKARLLWLEDLLSRTT